MAKYTWAKDTVPNKPGIWMYGGSQHLPDATLPIARITETGIARDSYREGWWCFVCDVPKPEMPEAAVAEKPEAAVAEKPEAAVAEKPEAAVAEKPWFPVYAAFNGATMEIVDKDVYDLGHVIVENYQEVPEPEEESDNAFAGVFRQVHTARSVFVDSAGQAGPYLFARRK